MLMKIRRLIGLVIPALVALAEGLPAQGAAGSAGALLAVGVVSGGEAAGGEGPLIALFDTRSHSSTALSGGAVKARAGWMRTPAGGSDWKFQGDAALVNDRAALVLRRGGRGAELYCLVGQPARRAVLAPVLGDGQRLAAIAPADCSEGEAAVEAVFENARGATERVRFILGLGQPFVQAEDGAEGAALRVEAPCRFAVLPDFFADDIVVDAREIRMDRAELPGENFLLHLAPDRNAIVMGVWKTAAADVPLELSGTGERRVIRASEIPFGSSGKAWVGLLAAPGIWHEREIAAKDAGKILSLDWKAPFLAQWRVDWLCDDRRIDSWEMLTQNADGQFVKHGWFGQPESFGTPDWMRENRRRWTTVLGWFQYPCWLDQEGRGRLQPLEKKVRFQGPAVLYPINRLASTPIDQFTVVDLVRGTLGVGPCRYILDLEGQQKQSRGIATCAARTKLNEIYAARMQKEKRAEVEKTLDDVLAFVRHIRSRIEDYIRFGHETLDYLRKQKAAHPELAGRLGELETLTRRIDQCVAERKEKIATPEQARRLVDDFRAELVDYEGPDALEKCQAFGRSITTIGGNQDELAGECRMAVKILRQRAAWMVASEPRMADISKEIRRRTQEILRHPAAYEAPRH